MDETKGGVRVPPSGCAVCEEVTYMRCLLVNATVSVRLNMPPRINTYKRVHRWDRLLYSDEVSCRPRLKASDCLSRRAAHISSPFYLP